MSPGGKGCLGALAGVAAAAGIAGALVGPRLLRTARDLAGRLARSLAPAVAAPAGRE